jgi:hypothetical protein
MHTGIGDPSRAREGRHRVPDRAERVRLASTFGAVLRVERAIGRSSSSPTPPGWTAGPSTASKTGSAGRPR